mgnify:FL=1
MPYDPRPISEGGNKGIDEEFSRKARKGCFRVISVDTFDGSDCHHGDRRTLERAMVLANTHCGTMQRAYIYDDQGKCVWSGGSY